VDIKLVCSVPWKVVAGIYRYKPIFPQHQDFDTGVVAPERSRAVAPGAKNATCCAIFNL
jgi:hypothetical protein